MSKYIFCAATSVQRGYKRFPDRYERPQVKAWRCDLTALSRSHNFYFVACNDAIYVYQPEFPDQSIPGQPELILNPPTTSPYLQPGIDHEDSHSITRLHVDYLGRDEIILITCDDGDVIGYRTEEIQRVVDRRREVLDSETDFLAEEPVRTFLHRNVGASAWGLAIHQEARMIAISANTHKVTVIAYALARPDGNSDTSSISSDRDRNGCSDEEDPTDFPSPRREDHIITLAARHNVPSVSFNNSGDDSGGRWLSSCSINGETLIWDLHHPEKCVRAIRLGFCASVKDPTKAPQHNPGSCACLRPSNFPHAIWSNMFLEATAAYQDPSLQDMALPLHHDHPLPYIQDVSACKSRFTVKDRNSYLGPPDVAQYVQPHAEASEMSMWEEDSNSVDDSESEASSASGSASISPVHTSDSEDHADEPMVQELTADAHLVISGDTDEGSTNDENISHIPSASYSPPTQIPSNAINAFGVWFQPPNNTATIVWDDGSDSEDEMFIPTTAQAQMAFANAIQPVRAYCEVTTAFTLARQPQLTSPLLIVTKEDVYLYQRPLDYTGDHLDPIVTIRRPLHPDQHQSPFPFIPGSHDRHCYTTQIPELGIFIIASPHGRAGVFSLTRAPESSKARPQYSFLLEYVLPFANDDKSKIWDVEGARLIGVAAGPVQGMLDESSEMDKEEATAATHTGKPEHRRWRLMMYFTDHTVLAFELGKLREGETPGLGELIV